MDEMESSLLFSTEYEYEYEYDELIMMSVNMIR
jgi:hypothetical protein